MNDEYKDAIVIKYAPKPKLKTTPNQSTTSTPNSNPTTDKEVVAVPGPSAVDIKQIAEREKHIEELLQQYNQSVQSKVNNSNGEESAADNNNVAVDFFLKMVKTYFALVLKFGDTVANTVIRMTMPAQITDPIISDKPLNVAELIKTADRVNQVLANPGFKAELGHMFENTSDAVNPQIKMLLNKMADVLMDVAGKTGSKLASTAAISLSAFPPFAVAFDIANLMSAGLNLFTSGIKTMETVTTGVAKGKSAYDNVPGVNFNKYLSETKPPKGQGQPPKPAIKKGGNIVVDVGKQVFVDAGGQEALNKLTPFQNAFTNLTTIVNKGWEEITKPPQKGGAKKTRRTIERIQKTMHDYNKTNRLRKTKRH